MMIRAIMRNILTTVLIHIKINPLKGGPHFLLLTQAATHRGQAALIMYSLTKRTLWKGRGWLRGKQHDLGVIRSVVTLLSSV